MAAKGKKTKVVVNVRSLNSVGRGSSPAYDTVPGHKYYRAQFSVNNHIIVRSTGGVRVAVPMLEPCEEFFAAVAKLCSKCDVIDLTFEVGNGSNRIGCYGGRRPIR